jgi:hypothetical protein
VGRERSLALIVLAAGLGGLGLWLTRDERRDIELEPVAPRTELVELHSGPDLESRNARTAALGEVESFPPLEIPLAELRLDEYPGWRALQQRIEREPSVEDVAVIPSLPATLEVAVRGPKGEPFAGHEVRVTASSSSGMPQAWWSVSTDAAGWCEILEIPSGVPLALRLYRGDELLRTYSDALELRPGERRRVEWMPWGVGGCRLAGQAFHGEGDLVDGLEISLTRSARRETDEDSAGFAVVDALGRFEMAGVPPGMLWFRVTRGTSTLAVEPRFVQIKPDERERFVELRVREPLYLRGSVLGPREEPAANCTVTATGRSTGIFVECASDEQGVFELGPLVNDEYRLQARARTYAPHFAAEERSRLAVLGESRPLLARAGDEGIVLRLCAAGTLRGTVQAEGEKADHASVTAQLFASGIPGQRFTARGGTTFEFDGLPPGSYHVAVATDGGLFGARSDVTITGGAETEIELTLQSGGRLVVVPAPGRSAEILRAWWGEILACEAWIDADEPTEVVVPAGKLRLEILEQSAVPRVVHEWSIAVAADESHRIDMGALPDATGSEGGK